MRLASVLMLIGLMTALISGSATAQPVEDTRDNKPPNILFIMADDLGWGDLACYGNTEVKTPVLDQLAAEGTLFTRYYTCAPVCSPARAAILTGQFPSRVGVFKQISADPRHNDQRGQVSYVDTRLMTVAKAVGAYGYRTAHFGKWHLGKADAPNLEKYGFDHHISVASSDVNPQYNRSLPDWDWMSTEWMVDDAIEFIDDSAQNPFYIQLWLQHPHTQLDPTHAQSAEYTGDVTASTVNGWRSSRHAFYSAITAMDASLGRLFDELDARGLRENTIVIFTSDNGPTYVTADRADHAGAGSAGPFRGRKWSLYEGGIRVPLIVRWPGVVPAGRIDDDAILSGVDWLPTFCQIAAQTHFVGNPPACEDLDGEDILEALKGNPWERSKDILLDWRFGMPTGLRQAYRGDVSPGGGVISGPWKFLRDRDGRRVELYQLALDPMEVDNRALHNPQLVELFTQRVLQWQSEIGECLLCGEEGNDKYPWPTPHREPDWNDASGELKNAKHASPRGGRR